MPTETIVLIALAAALAFSLILLLWVSLRRRRGAPETLELLGRRLEQLDGLSRDIDALSKVFLVPHTRGGLGETLLAELLRNWLPGKSYELQYSFSNGTRVDAVIRLGEFLVPIDAKFPLESVKRSIEEGGTTVSAEVRRAFLKHIEAIGSKYIRPEEGTLQFGLMYIPSERVYYHAFVEAESGLLEEAMKAGVIPVSPGGLFLYLQTVAYGLRGLRFSGRQRELLEITTHLKREVSSLKKTFETGTAHLRNLTKNRDETARQLTILESAVHRLDSSVESGAESDS